MIYTADYIDVEYLGGELDVYLGDYRVLSVRYDSDFCSWRFVDHLISDLGELATRERAVGALIGTLESYYQSDCDNEFVGVIFNADEIRAAIEFIRRPYYVYRWTPSPFVAGALTVWRWRDFPAWERVSVAPSMLPEIRRDQRAYKGALGKCRNVTHYNDGMVDIGGINITDFRSAWRLITLHSETTSTYTCAEGVWRELMRQPHAFEQDYELVGTYTYPPNTRYVKYTIRDFDVF